ncbi:MAG: LytS/YhcK type 5TM receptor domain-containing protein [Methanobacteriaceae archaeon]|nr:LytS/YhcK type 5TM receptor domain-containing protein [Methanobacteriaceae archaeon]
MMSSIKKRFIRFKEIVQGDDEVPIMYIHAIMAIVGSVSVLLILEFKELPLSSVQHTLLVLVEKTCVIVVIAYVVSRLSCFTEILEGKLTMKNHVILIIIFGAISIFGTYSGIEVLGAMANVRDLGPMVAGLVGGPVIGLGAGIIGGLYRLSLGGFTAVPCALSTILSGLLAGLIYIINKRQFVGIYWAVLFAILMESLHMLLTLALARPYSQALLVVNEVSMPMIFSNALGMFIFAFIISNLLRERKVIMERDLYHNELERKKHEIKVASKIQRSFLPSKELFIPGFDLALFNIPASDRGGDFYDVIPLAEDRVGLVIADVYGESYPASLLMALSRTIIKAEAKNKTPQSLIKYLNNLIAVDIKPELFITILYGELDLKNHIFTYVNASHNPPLIFKNNRLDELEKDDRSLGRLEDIQLKEYKIKINSGDILIFYTDGVIKSLETTEKSGFEVLRNMIIENIELSPSILVEKIRFRVVSPGENSDDLVLAVLKAG